MPIAKSEILQQQKVAFFEAYKKIRQEHPRATLYTKQWLVHKTLNSEAPQTFISYEAAQKIVCEIESGKYVPYKRELIEERNQNLYKIYKKLVAEAKARNELIIKTILVEKAIYTTTPRFYIEMPLASRIVYQFDKEGRR